MAQRRISLKRIREALRLREHCNLSERKIARTLSMSRPVVKEYLQKCTRAGVTYEKSMQMTDDTLYACFSKEKCNDPRLIHLTCTFPQIAKDLTKVGVTRQLLWEEYLAVNPDGYSYSQFCYHFQQWNESREMYMRIEHKSGDKMYVDYAGKKMESVDSVSGEVRRVEVFVAALGASKLIYAEAVWTQKKHDFIGAQVNALRYIGGVPQAIVPDCLKSAVTKGHRYEPDINPEYQDFASHYGTTILAARPYRPRDKAAVEGAVKIVYHRIYAPLRDRVFHSIEELNRAIREQLEDLNTRQLKEYGVSRWELFGEIEKESLMPLPAEAYAIRHFQRCTVHFNYHIYLSEDRHYYSVPYQHRGTRVEVRYTDRSVEIYRNNSRIAVHRRDFRKFQYTTVRDHMPPGHRFMNDWSADKFIVWARNTGAYAAEAIEHILGRKEHPEQGYKVCLGILNLSKEYGKERLNNACRRAIALDAVYYRTISNMLRNGLENMDADTGKERQLELYHHENIRGPEYYH